MFFQRRCKITFIAHGATIYSDEYRFSNCENYPPLSEAGEEEIEKICQFLKKRSVKNDKIYSSCGTRAVESAEIIAKIYKTNVEILDDLKPRLCGNWNNMTLNQLMKQQPDNLLKLIEHPDERVCENSESLKEFVERVGKSIDKIIKENMGNRIIIVTYPDVIQAAIIAALKLPEDKLCNFFIKTGSATQISYYETLNSLKYCGYVPIY